MLRLAAGVAAWTWLCVTALNWLHQGRGKTAVASLSPEVLGPATEEQLEALRLIEEDVKYFVGMCSGPVPARDWPSHLATRRVSYNLEEVGAAVPLSWERMSPALPNKATCGLVPATAIAKGAVKALLEEPNLTVRRPDEWGSGRLTARCHHVPKERQRIIAGLLDVGLVVPLAPGRVAQ